MQNKLFVRNLAFNCADTDLRGLFAQFGEVTSVQIATDRDTGRARGFAFVEMSTQQQAEAAIRGLEGREFAGRMLHVAISEPREKRSNNGGKRW